MVVFASPDFGAEAYAVMVLFLVMISAAGLITLVASWAICSARDLGWAWWGRAVVAALGSVVLSVVLFAVTVPLVGLLGMPLLGLLAGGLGGLVFWLVARDVPELTEDVNQRHSNSIASGRSSEGIQVAGPRPAQVGFCRRDDICERGH
jgi:hypothetical protein